MKKVGFLLAALALAGCGGNDNGSSDTLVVYSGREEELVAPLFERFEQETGIDVEVRYADSAELAATIAEEGDNSPADVFFAQDPGSLGCRRRAAREAPGRGARPRRRRASATTQGRWVGTSGRARVIVYNTDELSEDEVPDSVFDLTDPKWKGKIGIPPTNASFQAFVTAMRLDAGEERTKQWLEELKANDPKFYEKNTPIVEAVAVGRDRARARQPLLPLPRQGGAAATRRSRTSTCPATIPARSSASPARASSTAPTTPTPRSGSSSSCSPTSSSASTPRRPRRRRSRSSTGSTPKEGVPTLDELADSGPDVDLSSFGRGAREDARAAERDRLHVVSHAGETRRRAPLSLLLPARRHRRAAAPPARVPDRAGGSGGSRGLARADAREHARSALEHRAARRGRHRRVGDDRRLGRLARRRAPTCPAAASGPSARRCRS